VLTTKSDTTKTEETRTGELTRIDASGRDRDAGAATDNASSARETGTVAQDAQRTPPQAAPPAPVSQNPVPSPPPVARNTLPRTASQLSLAGLIGVLSLVAFSSVRLWRTSR
jgi:hypothetical protein